MKKSLILLPLLGACAASGLSGQVLYKQSFDYGGSVLDFGNNLNGDGWSDNTGVISYQPAGGLSYANYTSTGGALVYNFAGSGTRSAAQSTTILDYSNYTAGDVFHVFALGRVNTSITDGGITKVLLDGGTVNDVSFGIKNVGGTYSAFAEAFNSSNVYEEFGTSTISADTTVGFLMRITKGTGIEPTDTKVEVWINPDLTGVNLLAPLPVSFDSSSSGFIASTKGARDADVINKASFGGVVGGGYTWDEVNVIAVPEPSTYALALGFLALGGVMLRRRLRD